MNYKMVLNVLGRAMLIEAALLIIRICDLSKEGQQALCVSRQDLPDVLFPWHRAVKKAGRMILPAGIEPSLRQAQKKERRAA